MRLTTFSCTRLCAGVPGFITVTTPVITTPIITTTVISTPASSPSGAPLGTAWSLNVLFILVWVTWSGCCTGLDTEWRS
jgi:hypothetical protein